MRRHDGIEVQDSRRCKNLPKKGEQRCATNHEQEGRGGGQRDGASDGSAKERKRAEKRVTKVMENDTSTMPT